MLVLDASGAVQAALAAAGFRLFGGENLIASKLMWSQATSVLHEMQWRREISEELADAAFVALQAAPIGLRNPAALRREAWRTANELGRAKTYDAEYIELARLNGCKLFTVDERLRRGAGRIVEIIGPNSQVQTCRNACSVRRCIS